MDFLEKAFSFVVGGIVGLFSKNKKDNAQDEAVRRQTDLMDLEWQQSVKKANDSANKADRQTTLAEAVLGNDANQALRKLGYEEEVNALNYNQQSVGLRQQQGAGNAALASSGTEGSSALAAVQMERDYGDLALQAKQDADRQMADLTLAGIMGNIEESTGKLQESRTDAMKLRKDFEEGGDAHQIYQKQRANYIADNSADRSLGSWVNAFLQGGSTGYTTAKTVADWKSEWGEATDGGQQAEDYVSPFDGFKQLGSSALDVIKEAPWNKNKKKTISWSN